VCKDWGRDDKKVSFKILNLNSERRKKIPILRNSRVYVIVVGMLF